MTGTAAEATPAPDRLLPVRLLLLGTASGGILLGGPSVAGLTAVGRLSPHFLSVNVAVLFVLGCAVAAPSAALLGLAGRPVGATRRETGRLLLRGLVLLPPALIPAALLAAWMALVGIAPYIRTPGMATGVAAAWLLGMLMMLLAGCEALSCLRNLRRHRWARRETGRRPDPDRGGPGTRRRRLRPSRRQDESSGPPRAYGAVANTHFR
jgi:hypothetical protein